MRFRQVVVASVLGACAVGTIALPAAGASKSATQSRLKKEVLRASDLPKGWTLVHTAVDTDSPGPSCLKDANPPKSWTSVAVTFRKKSTFPSLGEVLATGSGAAAELAKLEHVFSSCRSFTEELTGVSLRAHLTPISLPTVGSSSAGFELRATVKKKHLDVEFILFAQGSDVAILGYGSLGGIDQPLVNGIAAKAAARVSS